MQHKISPAVDFCHLLDLQSLFYFAVSRSTMSASLILEDGTEITGKQFGANKSVAGEVGKLLFYFKYVC